MRSMKVKLILALVMFIPLHAPFLGAQDQGGSQRDYIKRQVQYNRWQDLLRSKPEVRYDEFKLDDTIVSPWRIQRVQETRTADRRSLVEQVYVLAKSNDPKRAEEILLVSVARYATRADAAEGLINHLLNIQRPDFKLVEDDALSLGDLTVNFPGRPEPAIFFFRGNILIAVQNAGQKAAADLRDLAQALDENLKRKRR